MAKDTKRTGTISELKVIAKLVEQGNLVSIPYGDNARYDLIIDEGDKFIKVQVKTAWLSDDEQFLMFNARSVHSYGKKSQSYDGQADIFLVYAPFNDKIYRFDVNGMPQQPVIRLSPPKNNQNIGIRYAKDYEI